MYELIINPASRSGNGMRIWKNDIQPELTRNKIPYHAHFSHKAGDVKCLAEKITESAKNAEEPVRLIILGGDGTFNEALQGISSYENIRIGYIPTGSSNDLARDMGIPKDPKKALSVILDERHVCRMDLGCVTTPSKTTYFAVSCGIGYDAAVCEEAMQSGFKDVLNRLGLGKLTYFGIAVKQLISTKRTTCDLYLDDAKEPVHFSRFLFCVSMIHRYEGGGFKFCPDADCCDGVFQLCLAGNIAKLIILFALPTAFWGKHYMFRGIYSYRAKKIRIQTSSPLWVHTDGEVHEKPSELTITCRQGVIPLITA